MTWAADEFGQTWAEVYDDAFAHLEADAAEAVALLTELLTDGAHVLELGVGTGRIAIPLAGAGLRVTGVDASPRMLQRLAAKSGGDAVAAVLGDMADPPVDGVFDAVLIAFNTFFSLPTQEAQVACVSAAADVLGDGGLLIVEAAVPQPWRFAGAEWYGGDVRDDQVALETSDHDPVGQTVRAARVLISDTAGVRTLPLKMRYAWPSEIDLMARLAGLVRVHRWAGWRREPFDAHSTRHITIYRRRADAH